MFGRIHQWRYLIIGFSMLGGFWWVKISNHKVFYVGKFLMTSFLTHYWSGQQKPLLDLVLVGCVFVGTCQFLLGYLIYWRVPCKETTMTITSILWDASVQFSSVAQSCPTLCDPMNRSTPGLPVHHQFPDFTQTHMHRVGDAIQPSYPLLSPSPPAPNPSQHQGLF